MFGNFKKIIVGILCLIVLSVGLIVPQKTYAIPVVDVPLTALQGSSFATSLTNWVTTIAKWAKDELAKSLRDAVVKAIVNEINKQTVAWIQGSGTPKFVTDWKGFVKNAGLEAVNQTISQSKLADLCTPFAPQLRIALIPETKPISQTAKCTITDIVANVQGFYDNFQNGGWLAYGEAIKPENNLYMQLVIFGDETKIKTSLNQEVRSQEASAGSGFLSVSKCVEDDSQQLYEECAANASSQGSNPEDCYAWAAQAASCTKKQVQTPGDAVAASVKNMIGADNIYVSGVQSIISAAINAGINRMMKEGLNLMTGNENANQGFNPASQFQTELDAFASSTKNDLKASINPTYNQWKVLIDIKNQSASYNTQIGTNLGLIKTIQDGGIACPPQVSAADTAMVNQTANVLSAYIGILQPKINDAEAILRQINEMDTNNIRQSTLVNEAIKAFSAKYIADDPKNAGATFTQQRQDALDEQSGIKNSLNDTLTRLQTCQTAKALATATSTAR